GAGIPATRTVVPPSIVGSSTRGLLGSAGGAIAVVVANLVPNAATMESIETVAGRELAAQTLTTELVWAERAPKRSVCKNRQTKIKLLKMTRRRMAVCPFLNLQRVNDDS